MKRAKGVTHEWINKDSLVVPTQLNDGCQSWCSERCIGSCYNDLLSQSVGHKGRHQRRNEA